MSNSLIFNLSNDYITIATGSVFKDKPVILSSLTRKYDKLFSADGKTIDANFLYKELRSMLEELFCKKAPFFDDVYVVIPDIKNQCYISNIVAYTSNPNSIIQASDIKNLYISAEKKHNADPNKQAVSITAQSFSTEGGTFFNPPIGESSASIKMQYTVYMIDRSFYNTIYKIMNKLGIKSPTITLNAVELTNLIRISGKDYPKHSFIIDSSYTKTQLSIVGTNMNFYNVNIELDFSDLVEEFVQEYDIAYGDVAYLINTYGYDSKKHPVKVLIYDEINNLGVNVKIYQTDLNERIDKFIDEFVSKLTENQNNLKAYTNVANDVDLDIICLGDLFRINGFKRRLEQKLNKELIEFNNKFQCNEDVSLYAVISALSKIEEHKFEQLGAKKDPIVSVTRGE